MGQIRSRLVLLFRIQKNIAEKEDEDNNEEDSCTQLEWTLMQPLVQKKRNTPRDVSVAQDW